MNDNVLLNKALLYFNDKISECIKSNKLIGITTHIDCDGIISGSIITKSLIRAGVRCITRTTKEFNKKIINNMKNSSIDFHIITDLGGQFSKILDSELGDEWIILDHHQIPEDEFDNERVINSWKYGIDGGKEICAGSMAYLAAKQINEKNVDLAWLSIISALGDRQDQGEKKSFVGNNLEIAEQAKNKNQIKINLDLLLVGRETRSIPDALASTSYPFIEGLTWNRDACLSLLNSTGIELKKGNRWRVPAELNDNEKSAIIEAITKFITNKNATEITNELIGYSYILPNEDKRSFLRDCREFSTTLNSCGRIENSGIGIALCMGDRTKIKESEKILLTYKKKIREQMNIIINERWRINHINDIMLINGEGVIPETMTGTICSLMLTSQKNKSPIIMVRTNADNNTIKFSSRKKPDYEQYNLSKIMIYCAEKADGIGGGHKNAAGAKITKDKLDIFLDCLENNVTKM